MVRTTVWQLLWAENSSSFLLNAIKSSEDKSFFNHFGLSINGIPGAVMINLREGCGPFEGHVGSSITQQFAKLLFWWMREKKKLIAENNLLQEKF